MSKLLFCYGIYLHGNGLFLLNIYQLYLTLSEIISKLIGAYALLSGRCWAWTHFGQPLLSVCPDSGGSRSWFTLTGILMPQGAVLTGSNPPWRGEVHHLAPEATLSARTHLKKGLVPYSSGWWDGRQILITSKLHESTRRTFLTVA